MTIGQKQALAWLCLGQECIVSRPVWDWLIREGVIVDGKANSVRAFEILSGTGKPCDFEILQ